MKAINRLNEAKISKYNKYINKLIPEINKNLRINLSPVMLADPYTYRYRSLTDMDGEFMTIILDLTNNRVDLEGILWGTFNISGRTVEIGELFGNLKDDLAIIEDTYYGFFEELENHGERITAIDLA